MFTVGDKVKYNVEKIEKELNIPRISINNVNKKMIVIDTPSSHKGAYKDSKLHPEFKEYRRKYFSREKQC